MKLYLAYLAFQGDSTSAPKCVT